MLTRRTALAAMTAGTAAAGLAACSSGGSGGSGSDAGGSANGPMELTYMHRLPDGEGMVPVADIVERWNSENPDIKVNAIKFDGVAAEMVVRLKNDINAGTGPDLAQVGYAEVPGLFTDGLLMDVAEYAAEYESNYAPGVMGLMGLGDAVVGLPQDSGPLVYFYNAAEFDRLGIAVPTTAEELLDAARTAKEDGKLALSFQTDEAQYGLAGQAAAAGAVWYRPEGDAWTVNVTSDETSIVADFWQTALDEEITLTEPRWGEGFSAALVDGTLIGTIGAAWEAALLAGDMAGTDGAGNWKVAQLPAFGSTPMSGPDGGSGVAVLKGCEFPAEAMKFNDWFNSQVSDLATQGLVVASTQAVETPESLSEFFGGQDVMAELATANETMNADFIYMPTWSTLSDPMVQAADAAVSGSGKTADIFQAAQDTSISSLKEANLPVNE